MAEFGELAKGERSRSLFKFRPSVDLVSFSASFQAVLQKLTASFVLLVMALLITFHSPAVGYCPVAETYFVGDHSEEKVTCESDCGHSETPAPVEHEHQVVQLDAGEFQCSAPFIFSAPRFSEVILPDWLTSDSDLEVGLTSDWLVLASPPPPDLPIFRRDAALRI